MPRKTIECRGTFLAITTSNEVYHDSAALFRGLDPVGKLLRVAINYFLRGHRSALAAFLVRKEVRPMKLLYNIKGRGI